MRLTWLIGLLTLVLIGCGSGGPADRGSTPTVVPGTDTPSQKQLAAPSVTQATLSGPVKQIDEPSPPVPGGELVFDMKKEYRLGEAVEVTVRNNSDVDYYYQFQYPACYNLQFFDNSQESRPYPNADPVLTQRYLSPGRFIVPRGTHCDTIWEKFVEPGQSVVIFTWEQQMCIKDRWGCIESVPVEPGDYLIRGGFSRVRAAAGSGPSPVFGANQTTDEITTITWEFTIQER